MVRGRSPNPRPRQTRRMREEDAPGNEPLHDSNSSQEAQHDAGNTGEAAQQQPPPAPGSAPAAEVPMLRQMFEFLATTQQQQQQQQFAQLMQQQALFQQQQQTSSQKQQKKKGNPPMFNGESSDDLELWLFSTEQYYFDCQLDMASNTSEFVNLIFGNLGTAARTWYRHFKVSLGENPATWALFKQ